MSARRATRTQLLLGLLSSSLLIFAASCGGSANLARPNIVILMVDDLGWNDVSYHGGDIPTPNIDAFVASGLELDRFYTTPWCSPTRAGLMTGMYPHRYGFRYIPKFGKGHHLPPSAVVLPEVLGSVGYRHRGLIGKWHLGGPGSSDKLPTRRGFTFFYGHLGGMIDYFRHVTFSPRGRPPSRPDWYRNERPVTEAGYATDLLAQEAERFIEARAGEVEPFFLFVSFNAPHAPLQAKDEDLERLGVLVAERYRGKLLTPDNALNRRIASAMIENLDTNVGRVLDSLDRAGLRDESLVLFLSDNGGQTSWGASDNRPLRGEKGTTWEGGVRVPAAVRWPGVFPVGERLDELVAYLDILPTLSAITGAKTQAPLDGIDVFDLLVGGRASDERLLYLGEETFVTREWKLVGDQLFRIERDPGETRDVAAEHPGVVAWLRDLAGRTLAPERQ